MKNQILQNSDQPASLEQLYRKNKPLFKKAFDALSPEEKSKGLLSFWESRLNYKESLLSLGNKNEFWVVLAISLFAGSIANISNLPGINKELFFSRNITLLIFPFVGIYFLWKQEVTQRNKIITALAVLILALYINIIPNAISSSSVNLIYIHFPILMWSILGFAFLGNEYASPEKRIAYLKYNGNLVIIVAIILLSCIAFTLITFGLFGMLGIKIEQFYFQYIAIWAIGAIPVFGTYLIFNNPQLINKVTPLIAKIFTPLACINLFIYLVVLMYTGKFPHNDRNLLLIYNILLIAVLALIFFSIAEKDENKYSTYHIILLIVLASLTLLLNGIALFAIGYRIMEYGFTPNRLAVLGANVLVFINLIIVTIRLLNTAKQKSDLSKVEMAIANYLPVYSAWALVVVMIFPILFNWR